MTWNPVSLKDILAIYGLLRFNNSNIECTTFFNQGG